MSDRPLVSVIIIFLNAARFIEEAVASVAAQTYDSWQLLMVDDGSTDASTDIARRYAAEQPDRFYYLEHANHQNRGMSASRNLGLHHARGEFIAFLDADDVWLPHKLETQVALMHAQPEAAMVYGASQYWYSWTGEAEDLLRDHTPRLGVEPQQLILPPTLLTLSLQSTARTPCPSDFLVRRSIAKEVGGFEEQFREQFRDLFEDQAFLAKVFLKAPVFVTNECWDKYRQHSDSCVAVAAKHRKKYSAGLFYFDWLKKYLLAQGITDSGVWEALRKKRSRYRYMLFWQSFERSQQLGQLKTIIRRFAKRSLPASVRRSLRID